MWVMRLREDAIAGLSDTSPASRHCKVALVIAACASDGQAVPVQRVCFLKGTALLSPKMNRKHSLPRRYWNGNFAATAARPSGTATSSVNSQQLRSSLSVLWTTQRLSTARVGTLEPKAIFPTGIFSKMMFLRSEQTPMRTLRPLLPPQKQTHLRRMNETGVATEAITN
jgi:hypothetical protein